MRQAIINIMCFGIIGGTIGTIGTIGISFLHWEFYVIFISAMIIQINSMIGED